MSYNKIFKNWKQNYLVEARIDKIKKQYAGKEGVIDALSAGDPSGNDKYLGWMAKQAVKGGKPIQDVIDIVKGFETNRQRLNQKDINQWKFDDLKLALSVLGKSKTSKKNKDKEGTIKIHEDENYIILSPLNRGSSCLYGSGTRWCISATDSQNFFDNYAKKNKITFVFVIDKTGKETPLEKIALVFYSAEHMEQFAQATGKTVEELAKDPQEIFLSNDDLSCQIEVPKNLQYADLPLNPESGLPNCAKWLDEYFDGQWSGKYRDIINARIGDVRTGIEKEAEKDAKYVVGVYDKIAKVCAGETPWPFKNFEFREPQGGERWMLVNPITESYLYRNATKTNYDDGYRRGYADEREDKILKFYAVAPVDPRKLGWKRPELSLRELFGIAAWANFIPDERVEEYIQEMFNLYEKLTGNKEDTLQRLTRGARERWNSLAKLPVERAIYEVLKNIPTKLPTERHPDVSVGWEPGDEDSLSGNMRVLFNFNPLSMDDYIFTFEKMLYVDQNLDKIFAAASKTVNEQEQKTLNLSGYRKIFEIINPDREYWFWEPIK